MENRFSTSINENGEIRWTFHPLHLKLSLNTLRESGKFADCFIFVERRTIPVHRFILSMFSPYFEVVLSETYDKHPAIILNDDVTYQDAEDLLKYIYTGEVTIDPARIDHFTEVCIKLEILGFCFAADSIEVDPPNSADFLQVQPLAFSTPKIVEDQKLDEPPRKTRKHAKVLTELNGNKHQQNTTMEAASSQESDERKQKTLKLRLPKLKLSTSMKAPRPKGGKSFTPLTSGNLIISRRPSVFPSEMKLFKPETFPCSFCDRSYKTRQSLNNHRQECKSNPNAVVRKECPNCHKVMLPSSFYKHKKKCGPVAAGSSNKENEN